jgi:membrane protein involved in colicin uptake
MAFFSSAGRRGPNKGSKPVSRPPARSGGKQLDEDRLRLEKEIAEITRQAEEAERLAAQKMREMEDLPRKIAARERKQHEMIRMRAALTATDDVFGGPRDKRHAPLRRSGPKRMTRKDQSAARMQLLMLGVVLAVLLILLWRSLP